MRILIATGIYPPDIGGPAQYASRLKNVWERGGHKVSVGVFSRWNFLPTGVRHLVYMLSISVKVLRADYVLVLDTFSSALPAVLLGKIFSKKTVVRTGGDFLWEQYVERTGKKILFRNFYQTETGNFSKKEKDIFKITRWVLQNTSHVVFSTDWQRDIFVSAYGLDKTKTSIIENYYGPKEGDLDFKDIDFVGSTRDLVWKNLDTLRLVFDKVQEKNKNVQLYTDIIKYPLFMEQIKKSYAVALISLGDISPNMILDAIRYNRPFICTREVGIFERIKEVGIFVDPLNPEEIEDAVFRLLDKDEYEKARQKVRSFSFVHSWEEIAVEFEGVYKNIK